VTKSDISLEIEGNNTWWQPFGISLIFERIIDLVATKCYLFGNWKKITW
jgi:hypothetical protein